MKAKAIYTYEVGYKNRKEQTYIFTKAISKEAAENNVRRYFDYPIEIVYVSRQI